MAVLDVLNLNLGTEQNPNWVLHDLHDKRISTNAVTTATHLLATDASLSAINPITAANLASVLGGLDNGIYSTTISSSSTDLISVVQDCWGDIPAGRKFVVKIGAAGSEPYAVAIGFSNDSNRGSCTIMSTTGQYVHGVKADGVFTWNDIYTTSLLTNPTLLSPLASALGGCVSNSYPTDLNTLTTPGIYGVTDSEVQNMPATGYGICIVIGSPALGALSQIQLCGLSEKLYYRRIGSTDYSLAEWKLL